MRKTLSALLLLASALCAGELSGRRAPGFSIPDLKGKQIDPQDYRGKLLIVDIMRTNCPSCAAFAKVLVGLQAKYGDKLGIISVVNPPDNQQMVAQFVAGHKITTPIAFDCGQVSFSYMRSVQFEIPHVFLIDGAGMIREDFGHSAINERIFEGDALIPYIDKLLAESAGKPAAGKKK